MGAYSGDVGWDGTGGIVDLDGGDDGGMVP